MSARDIGVESGELAWSRGELDAAVAALAARLRERGTRVLATLMDNGIAWVVATLVGLFAPRK